jgi:hypothetical protein
MMIFVCSRQAEPEGGSGQVKGQWSGSCFDAYYLMVEVGQITFMF